MLVAVQANEILTLSALGVLLLIGLLVGLYLLVGLFKARSLLRREFSAYFLSPIAYVVLVLFLVVTGHLFYLTLEQLTASGPKGVEFPMQLMLGDERFWLVFLFIPPLLTMRLFAEERSTGTLEMLMTAPLRDWQVVASKYVACLGFYVLLWLPTLAYLPVLLDLQRPIMQPAWTPLSLCMVGGMAAVFVAFLLALLPFGSAGRIVGLVLLLAGVVGSGIGAWGHYHVDTEHVLEIQAGIDPMPVLTSYLGLFLAGAMFLALGLLVSSLVRSQMVAALVSLVLSLVFIVAGFWRPDMDTSSPAYQVLYFFSVPLHFSRDFSRGLVDTRHLVLYGSVAVFCLFMTVRSLESRRWR
ncbi:MAG TPA: ABC transporter permease [Gemmataceae bacterium]|nr:ABC transporter permease [Gemmataceae bacterium]